MDSCELRTTILETFDSVDESALDVYLKLCTTDDSGDFLENHHILPKHAFPEYQKFAEYPWNKVSLSYSNHFLAHYWFAKAVDTWSAWNTVTMMSGENDKCFRSWPSDSIGSIANIVEQAKLRMREIGFSDSQRANMSKSLVKRHADPKYKLKHSEKMSETLTRMHRDPDFKERHKKAINKPEARQKQRDSLVIAMNTPEIKEKHLAGLRSSPVWQMPLYKTVFTEWVSTFDKNGNRLKRTNFAKHITNRGIYECDGAKVNALVTHFNNVVDGKENFWHDI